MKIEKPDKKSLFYLAIVLFIAILIVFGVLYYYSKIEFKETEKEILIKPKKESIIKQQLKELERLRGETQPLTEKEIQDQIKELNQARQKTQPLSQEEIQKQIEELNKLR